MQRLEVAGAIGADCTPEGHYVVSIRNQPLRTNGGPVPLPGEDLLFPVIHALGGIAGKGQSTDAAWLFTLTSWENKGPAHGNNPVIFDATGNLVVATPAQGSQGYRYRADDGHLITGDDSINPFSPLALSLGITQMWEWSHVGGITIGQGLRDWCVAILPSGKRVVLEPAPIVSCSGRVSHIGSRFAVAMVRPNGVAVLLWFDKSELDALPIEPPLVPIDPPVDPPIDPPVDPPIDPEEPDVPDIPNKIDVVQRVRAKYPTPLGLSHPVFLVDVAAEVERATGINCGLLRKPGGTVITLGDGTTVSQDFLTFKIDGDVWGRDILSDGEGAASPTWGALEQFPAERFYDVIPQGGGPVDPPVDPPGEVPAAVKAYVNKLLMDSQTVLTSQIAGLANGTNEAVGDLRSRVYKLEHEPAPGLPADIVRESTHKGRVTIPYLGGRDVALVKK